MKPKLFFYFLVCLCATLLNSCNEDPVINPEDVTASGTCGDGLTWTIVKDTALLITGKGEMADYVYCHDVNFRTEDQAPWAFHRKTITLVSIGGKVSRIGSAAFSGCSSLTSVTIPNSVTSIGEYAFCDCSGLTSIVMPEGLISIGTEAFSGCSGLTSITCEASQPPVLGDYEFTGSNRISQYHDLKSVFGKVDKTIPLYVPSNSVNLYRAAEGWKEFTNIIGK